MSWLDRKHHWPRDRSQWDREVAEYEAKYRPLVQGLTRPTELAALSNVVSEALRGLNAELKAASTETMRERGPNLVSRGLAQK